MTGCLSLREGVGDAAEAIQEVDESIFSPTLML
jgi:hypothetical protein